MRRHRVVAQHHRVVERVEAPGDHPSAQLGHRARVSRLARRVDVRRAGGRVGARGGWGGFAGAVRDAGERREERERQQRRRPSSRRQRRDGASSFTSAPRHPSLAAGAYRLARSKSNDGVRGSCLRWYPRLSASDRVSRLGDAHQRGPICSGEAGQIRNKIRIVSALRGRFVSSVQPSGPHLEPAR